MMPGRPDIRLTADEQAAFLQEQRKCALATLDRHGFPHVVAMNYIFRDGAFYMTSYGKAQKVVNIRRDPKVGVMVETGGGYAELKGVMARGDCEIIEDPDRVREVFAWMSGGRSGAERPSGSARSAPKRVVLKLVPHRVTSWDHGKLGGRY
jgi:PPOX class probable F420-dependent enzyme